MCKALPILAVLILAAGALLGLAAVSGSLPLRRMANAAAADPQLANQRDQAGDDEAGDKQPISIRVLVPADARVEFDGHKTSEGGERRLYETPPLPAAGWQPLNLLVRYPLPF